MTPITAMLWRRSVARTFYNGKPRKRPKVEVWAEVMTILDFVVVGDAIQAVCVDERGNLRVFPALGNGRRYAETEEATWLEVGEG